MKVKKSTFVLASVIILIAGAIIVSAVQMKVNQQDLFVSEGKVGIGTSSPVTRLDVADRIHIGGSIAQNVPNVQGAYIGWNALTPGGGTGETDFINNKGGGSGGFAFFNTPLAGTPLSTLMVITGSGNVGIGTTTPQDRLHVAGDISLQGAGVKFFDFNGDWNTGIWNTYADELSVRTGGVDRLTVDNARVGIGTTDPQRDLDVNGEIWNRGAYFRLGADMGAALHRDSSKILHVNPHGEFEGISLNANVAKPVRINDQIVLTPRETAPTCDQLGKIYVDTSGVYCFCTPPPGNGWLKLGNVNGECA